jgi:hypothetical protein
MKTILTFLSKLLLLNALQAQIIVPPVVQKHLDACGVELFLPTTGDYKMAQIPEEAHEPYQFSIRSNKEDVEIRFEFVPKIGNTPFAQVHSYRTCLHLGNNLDQTNFTARELSERELEDVFCADWGRVYIFRPKASFSDQQHCRFLVIHKEGFGMVCVYYLFDHPSEAIDRQLHIIRYKDAPAK